jgi:hypothetical protein
VKRRKSAKRTLSVDCLAALLLLLLVEGFLVAKQEALVVEYEEKSGCVIKCRVKVEVRV